MISPTSAAAPIMTANPANPDRKTLGSLFKAGMRQLAGGVCVIATEHDGNRHASTVTSVSSLSMDPPSMIVCINAGSSIHQPLQASRRLSVNLLSTGQLGVADRCTGFDGSVGEARFAVGEWSRHQSGSPVLDDALVSIVCTVEQSWTGGSHSVLLCAVESIVAGPPGQPLVYANRAYASLLPMDMEAFRQA